MPTGQVALDGLVALLDLERLEVNLFRGVSPPHSPTRVFGGQVAAQALVAAGRTVEPDRFVHSLHAYFVRPGDPRVPIIYEVERVRDGRGYSTRHVRAFQNDKAVYDAMGSFHVPEDGTDDAPPMPRVPAPEDLASSAEVLAGVDGPTAEYWAHGRSFDIRHVEGPVYLQVQGPRTAHQAVWVKAFDRLPDDPDLHRAALAYVCDYTILEPLLRSQGLAWAAPGLVTASLDHSMWFHREGRADEWVLYVQDACSLQNNRGLVRGQFFDRGGRLLAGVAQEGMIRPGA